MSVAKKDIFVNVIEQSFLSLLFTCDGSSSWPDQASDQASDQSSDQVNNNDLGRF